MAVFELNLTKSSSLSRVRDLRSLALPPAVHIVGRTIQHLGEFVRMRRRFLGTERSIALLQNIPAIASQVQMPVMLLYVIAREPK